MARLVLAAAPTPLLVAAALAAVVLLRPLATVEHRQRQARPAGRPSA